MGVLDTVRAHFEVPVQQAEEPSRDPIEERAEAVVRQAFGHQADTENSQAQHGVMHALYQRMAGSRVPVRAGARVPSTAAQRATPTPPFGGGFFQIAGRTKHRR